MAGGGAGCGVGHVAYAAGCPFSFSLPLFRFLCGVLCAGWVFGCFGMWGRVIFSLVSALCTLVQILIFGLRKSTYRGCFWGGAWFASAFWWAGGTIRGESGDCVQVVCGGVTVGTCLCGFIGACMSTLLAWYY